MMKVKVLKESGRQEAMLGLSLSYDSDVTRMPARADKLAGMDGGHNKFMESVCVWIDCTAPRYWWQQFDTYRVGVTKQSASTMHTLMRSVLEQHHFEGGCDERIIGILNGAILDGNFDFAKRHLPESFLQRRIICTNYKVLRHVFKQRKNHKLKEWQLFCEQILMQLEEQQWITA